MRATTVMATVDDATTAPTEMDDSLEEWPDSIDVVPGGLDEPVAAAEPEPATERLGTAGSGAEELAASGMVDARGAGRPLAGVHDSSGGFEQWSVLALVTSLIGAIPITWPVPILSLMAVGFGLVGLRNCQIEPSFRNRWMAVLGTAIALATLIVAIVLTALKHLQFLPFWTTN